jgi:hypothetical protein
VKSAFLRSACDANMAAKIEKIVEKLVAQVLESHLAAARQELVDRVLAEIQPFLGAGGEAPAAGGGATDLLAAVTAIQQGTTQREILRSLLDSMAKYSGRSALFVVKGGAATGWQGRGFSNNDGIKDIQLDTQNGLAARALQSRAVMNGKSGEMGGSFISSLGKPANDQVVVLPLLLKDKIAALVYADGGGDGLLDTAALEVLVLNTSAWLEVASLRKVSQRDGDGGASEHAEPAPAAASAPAFNDPFAGHAPRHAAPAPVAAAQPVMSDASSGAAASAPATDPFAGLSPEDADLHRKAQRFARLLVDEIKLYNQVKVSEGRKNKDLYDRLKEDIEKSRATYQKRYGNTSAANADYFNNEVIRSLAEDDVSIMGANFRR